MAPCQFNSRPASASQLGGRCSRRPSLVLVCAARSRSLPSEDESSKKPKTRRSGGPGTTSGTSPMWPGMQDWRTVRARLLALERSGKWSAVPGTPAAGLQPPPFVSNGWAHELATPEVGCLLIARGDDMGLFSKAVVLLVSHDEATGHSMGFVLNKQSSLTMAEVQLNTTASDLSQLFAAQPINLGGPCYMDTLTLLHAYAGLEGAQRVVEGVYYGGVAGACDLVRAGLAKPQDFRLLLGVAGWSAGQLAGEVAAGSWSVMAASKEVMLQADAAPGGAPRRKDRLWRELSQTLSRQRSQQASR